MATARIIVSPLIERERVDATKRLGVLRHGPRSVSRHFSSSAVVRRGSLYRVSISATDLTRRYVQKYGRSSMVDGRSKRKQTFLLLANWNMKRK